ncbi:MAG: hypothetical protein RL217_1714, partial [Pseudomonadota bacterium]
MSQDYIALEWVKGEIEETLQQARQALEAYVDNPKDKSQIKFCLSYLHQINGTLQMVEFYGAALLAEEMEAVCQSILDTQTKDERISLECLMQAIIQLPHYLEHIKVGRRDLPVVLLPILNELRSARGESLLSETALFSPVIQPNPELSPAQAKAVSSQEFLQWARKVRQMLQNATLQLLQNKEPQVAKQYLIRAFARLHKTLGHTPQGQVWLPALAFSEWLEQQQHLPSSARQLLRQLDSLLKEGIELGAVALNRPAPDELIKNLLFYVARTDVQSEAIAQVQEQFHLRQALPTEAELQQEREAFARPDRHTISDVLAVLIEEITAVKDGLDLLVRGQGDRLAALPELATSLKHIADTMGMLGLGMPRTVILEQLNLITQMQSSQASSDGILLDVAGALLYIEATLSGMQREGNFNAYVKETALSDAQKAVLREARNVLEEVKDAVIAYIANHWATNELLETPAMLHSIEGSLSMIPLPRVAGILAQSASFVKKVIEQQEQVPWPLLDTFADILSSVEYFLERYNEDARHADKNLLERAEQALLKLKHPVTPVTGDTEENLSFAGAENLPSLTIGQFSNTDARVIEEEILLDDNTPFDDEDETAPAPVIAAAPPTPAAPAPLMPVIEADDDLIDEEIIEIFLEEAEEVLEAIQGFWPVFKQDNNDKEALTTVRRSFHTLKGSGRMVKALVVGELAWSIENMFNRVLDNTISLSGNLVALVDHVIEQLPVLIDDFRHKRAPSVATQPLMAYAFALAQGQNVPTFSAAAMQADAPTPQADTSQPEPAVIPVQETLAAPQPAALGHKSEDDDEDDSLFDIFAQEARSHLETVDEFVELSVVEDYFNPLSDQLQRALHTLKGSAYMAQVDKIAQIAAPLEKFIKELRTYQVSNKPEIVAILTRASQIIADALDNPEQLVMSALPSSEAYLLELHDLEDLLLGDLQKNGANGSGLNPQAIAHFMEHGMDALLDADTLLQQWHNANDRSVLQLLRHDLSEASTGAAAAELPHVQQLADALNHFYGRLEDNHGDASNDFFSLVAEAHEALLTMLDCLAAGQETTSPASLIARLEAWQFTATTPTQNEDSEDLAVPELEIELEAPENYAELPVGEDAELLAIFLEEAQEISESVEAAMQRWRANPDDLLQVAQLQRELHTLKGGARMAEINSIADLCHELETLYERINDGRIRIEAGLFTLLQQAHDELSIQLELLQQGKMPHASKCLLAIQSYLSGQPISAAPVPADTPALSLVAPAAPLSTVQSSALDEADREILEIFMEEASELQEALEHALQDWEKAPSENTPAEEAQRVLHTLKGGARLAGLSLIGDIAHNFESDIVRAVQSPQAPDAIFFQHAYAQQDLLHHELEKVQKALSGDQFIALSEPSLTIEPFVPASAEAATPSASGDYLPAQHDDQDGHDDSADPSANSNVVPLRTTKKEASTRQNTAPQAKAPQELIKVSADLLDNLVNLAGETSIGRGRLEQQATDFSHTLEEMDETLERLRDQLRRLDMETEAQVLFRQERQGPTYEDFDPLEMDRYSTMQQLSRALVESAS